MTGIVEPDGFCHLSSIVILTDVPSEKIYEMLVQDRLSPMPRFEYKNQKGEYLVRALQGHTLKHVSVDDMYGTLDVADLQMREITGAVHFTNRSSVKNILREGLLLGGHREDGALTAIHMAPVYGHKLDGEQMEHMTLWAKSPSSWIYIDIISAMEAGLGVSINSVNVLLTHSNINASFLTEWVE